MPIQIQSNPESEGAQNGIPDEFKELLSSLDFFEGTSETDPFIEELSKVIILRTNYPGDLIIRQGDIAKAMFFIVKGILKVISDDGEIIFGELSSGSYGNIGLKKWVKSESCSMLNELPQLLPRQDALF